MQNSSLTGHALFYEIAMWKITYEERVINKNEISITKSNINSKCVLSVARKLLFKKLGMLW